MVAILWPELTFEVLEQTYARVGDNTYRYESAGGTFVRELTVDRAGFVVNYPSLWRVETTTDE